MFGGNVSPANSPHLRKSASRSRVFDLGIEFEHQKGHDFCHPMLEVFVVIISYSNNMKYF